jgi:hypothetical protein
MKIRSIACFCNLRWLVEQKVSPWCPFVTFVFKSPKA